MEADYVLDYDLLSVERTHHLYLLAKIKGHPATHKSERSPLNVGVVLDRSGSMEGVKLQRVKEAAQFLVRHLGADDLFSLVTYDTMVDVNFPPAPPTYKDKINQIIQSLKAGSATNLSGGWLKGCQLVAEGIQHELLPEKVADNTPNADSALSTRTRVNRVMLLTDGLANQGITDIPRLGAMAHQKREEGIPTTTMGVGMDFKEDLLTTMAHEGGGNFYFIDNPDKIPEIFARELQHLLEVVGQNLTITLIPSRDVQFVRQLNAYPMQIAQNEVVFRMGDLSGDEVKTLLLEVSVPQLGTRGTVEIARLRFDYDEITEEAVTHRTLELPIVINAVEEESYEAPAREPQVVKSALMLEAAHARKEALNQADKGDFSGATTTLRKMADEIEKNGLEDDELRTEHNKLREEVTDMEFGAARYDSHSRKVGTSQIFSQTHSFDYEATTVLSNHFKMSRQAMERKGATPSLVRWDKDTLDLTDKDRITIGRKADNDIVVADEAVSSHHCQILRENDDLYLEDLGSRNGTFANRGRIVSRFRLSVDDVVTVGSTLFRFE